MKLQLSEKFIVFLSHEKQFYKMNHIQAIPGNDQNASSTNQKTAGSKLDRLVS